VLIVNLGGEGEDIVALPVAADATVVHVNPLDYREIRVMAPRRTGFETQLRVGHEVVQGFAHSTGLRDECGDAVVAQSFPIQKNRTQDLTPVELVAVEAYRICRAGGTLAFHCSACDRPALLWAFFLAGFTGLGLDGRGYAVGRKM
jgi:hypothetical protein